jgi:hypothetical protein
MPYYMNIAPLSLIARSNFFLRFFIFLIQFYKCINNVLKMSASHGILALESAYKRRR